jgi:prephenate dehydratase
VEAVAYFDTAGSVKHIAESGQRDTAAIAGRHCAAQYGLKVLKAAIEDNPRNFTRFVVLSRRATPPKKGKSHKTSIVFDLRSRPGALHLALGIFARLEIQLFRIESRPIPGRPWQYLFYLDFEGEVGAPKSHSAIAELRRMALQVRVLGSYPIG